MSIISRFIGLKELLEMTAEGEEEQVNWNSSPLVARGPMSLLRSCISISINGPAVTASFN